MSLYSGLFLCQFFWLCLLFDGNIHRNIVPGVDRKHLQQCSDQNYYQQEDKNSKTFTSILAHLAVKLTFAQIRITANSFVWEKYKSENLTREVHCVGMAWNFL